MGSYSGPTRTPCGRSGCGVKSVRNDDPQPHDMAGRVCLPIGGIRAYLTALPCDIQSPQPTQKTIIVLSLRSKRLQQGLAVLLLVSSTIWMIVPQAFAGSAGMAEGGWLTHFLGERPAPTSGNGFQDASHPGALIVQPVVVAAQVSAPTVQKRQSATRPVAPVSPALGAALASVEQTTGSSVSFSLLVGSSIQALGP